MMVKPIRALEFHYAMIQFLIIYNTFIFTVEEERRTYSCVRQTQYPSILLMRDKKRLVFSHIIGRNGNYGQL